MAPFGGTASPAGMLQQQQPAAAQQLPGAGAPGGNGMELPGLLAQLLHHMATNVCAAPSVRPSLSRQCLLPVQAAPRSFIV